MTSAYSSYSSCRQYLQNISDAQTEVGPDAPRVEKLRVFYNHPLFIEANVDQIRAALAQLEDAASAHLVFTAHSIPESMAANCDYAAQLAETGSLIARRAWRSKTGNSFIRVAVVRRRSRGSDRMFPIILRTLAR